MNRRLIVPLMLAAVALFSVSGHSQEPNKTGAFMRLKLAHAQKLLEGLALEDFQVIEKNAQSLSLLTRDEMWQVYQTPEYLQYSAEFRRLSDDVVNSARKQNLDGAALSYVGLTLQCVQCHQHLRDVRMARGLNESSLRLPAVGE